MLNFVKDRAEARFPFARFCPLCTL